MLHALISLADLYMRMMMIMMMRRMMIIIITPLGEREYRFYLVLNLLVYIYFLGKVDSPEREVLNIL